MKVSLNSCLTSASTYCLLLEAIQHQVKLGEANMYDIYSNTDREKALSKFCANPQTPQDV